LDFPRGISQGLANDGQRGLLVGEASDPEGPEAPGLVVLGEDWLPSAMEPASPSVACKSTKRKPARPRAGQQGRDAIRIIVRMRYDRGEGPALVMHGPPSWIVGGEAERGYVVAA
jgi:hypothetical protein